MLSSLKGKDILGGMNKNDYLTQLDNHLKDNIVSFNEWRKALPTQELRTFATKAKRNNSILVDFDSYVKKSSQGLKGFASAFGASMKTMATNMGVMLAATLIIKVVAAAFDTAVTTFAEQKEKVDGLTEGYNKLKTELDGLKSKNPAELTQGEKDRLAYLTDRVKLEKQVLDIENRKLADSTLYGKGDPFSGGLQAKTAELNVDFTTNGGVIEDQLKKLEDVKKSIQEVDLSDPNMGKKLESLNAQEKKINATLDERKNKYIELEAGYLKIADDIKSVIDSGAYNNDEGALAKAKADMQYNLDQANLVKGVVSDIENSSSQSDFYTSDVFKEVEEDLKTLAAQGKLTADTLADDKYSKLKNKMDETGVSVEDLIGKFKDLSNESPVLKEDTGSYTNTIAKLKEMSGALGTLDTAYAKFIDKDSSIGFEDISSLSTAFKDVKGVENYVKAIQEAHGNVGATQTAFNDLTNAYLDQSNILDILNDKNADVIESALTEMGVENAHDIVTQQLTLSTEMLAIQKEFAAEKGHELENATLAELSALIGESDASDYCKSSLAQLALAKLDVNKNKIDTTSDIDQVIGLANAAGASISALNDLQAAKTSMVKNANPKSKNYDGQQVRYAANVLDKVNAGTFDYQFKELKATDFVKPVYGGGSTTKSALDKNSKGDSKGGSGGGSSKEVEAYKAEIDAYAKLKAELEKIQSDISTNEKKYDNTDGEKEKIALLQQRIALTQKEQSALHSLNNARDKEVSNNVKLLKQKGFLVNYNPDSNELEIANLEHLNDLKGKDQEATNDLIKKYEELISTTQSLNNENRESSNSWWDSYYNLSKYKDEIKDSNKQIYDNEVANQEHILELLNSRSGTEKEQIEIYTALQESALRRRQKLIDDDYVSNIEEIRSLENAWTSYYDNILEAKKKVLETQKESKDATINAITNLLDDQIKGIDDQIKALQKLNDERKEALDLQKAQAALDAAERQKTKSVLRKGQGYIYEADEDAITEAQENLADIQYNNQVSALEDEKEAIEEYKELWSSIPDAYEDAQNELIAEQELGANWEDKITDLRLSTYRSFKDDYFDLQDDIENKTEELNQHLNEEYINMVNIFQQMSTLMGKTPVNNTSIESMMSDSDQDTIKAAQAAYNTAKAQGNKTAMDSAHAMAESIRDKYRDGVGTDTPNVTSIGTPIVNASNITSYTKQPYELVSSTKTGGSSSGGNSSLRTEYERQLSLAEKYGGSDAYKSRLESAIAREVSGAGHTIETYNNGTTTSTIVKATNQAEATMSADEIRKKNEASVKNNTNSLDKVNSGLKGNTNATEYAGDAMYDASDSVSDAAKSVVDSNKENADTISKALNNLSATNTTSSNKSGSSSSSGESAEYKQWSTAYNTAKSQGNTIAMATAKAGMDSSKKKAKGGINLPADVYNVNEEGAELIIQPEPQQGNWVTVTNGTSILPADISRNLMDFGSDPTAYLRQASANQIAGVTRIQNNTSAPIINNNNIQVTLPNVKDAYDFMENLPQLARQYAAKR